MGKGVTPPPDKLVFAFCFTISPKGEVKPEELFPEKPNSPVRTTASAVDAVVSPTLDSNDRCPWNPSADFCESADVKVGD